MPGLEKKLARYAQFYSRNGFVHEFRPLSSSEVPRLLSEGRVPTGVTLPAISTIDTETAAAIIRVTGGNFRLLDRLLTQVERVVRINDLARSYEGGSRICQRELGHWAGIRCWLVAQLLGARREQPPVKGIFIGDLVTTNGTNATNLHFSLLTRSNTKSRGSIPEVALTYPWRTDEENSWGGLTCVTCDCVN